MGQKVHPFGFRLGYTKTWQSRWFSKKDYRELLTEDVKLRRDLKARLSHAVANIEIERAANKPARSTSDKPAGIIIGRRGAEVDKLKEEIQKRTKRTSHQHPGNSSPIRSAALVAENVALQLERRVSFRRAMSKIESSMRFGAKGVRIRCAGRLVAQYRAGRLVLCRRLPLHTLRADIEYGFAEAKTTYGQIGVKAWIFSRRRAGIGGTAGGALRPPGSRTMLARREGTTNHVDAEEGQIPQAPPRPYARIPLRVHPWPGEWGLQALTPCWLTNRRSRRVVLP